MFVLARFEDHSMIGPLAPRVDQLVKVDAPDLNFAGSEKKKKTVNDSTMLAMIWFTSSRTYSNAVRPLRRRLS